MAKATKAATKKAAKSEVEKIADENFGNEDFVLDGPEAEPHDDSHNEETINIQKEASKAAKKGAKNSTRNGGKKSYEEWRVEFVNGKMEKLKKVRDNVKLAPETVEELNRSTTKENPIHYF